MGDPRHQAGRARTGSVVIAAALAVASLSLVAAPAAATEPTRDGLTEATALASCWDVKQVDAGAASGVYWLYTPTLRFPQQFYCDMTTDGGGWVLIGRGRQGWSFTPDGQGTAASVYTPVSGTDAFAPKHLPTDTVNGLLDGGSVSALADGIRIRRAVDGLGATYQELRLHPSAMSAFRWTFGGGYPTSEIDFDGVAYTAANTTSSNLTTSKVQIDKSLRYLSTMREASNSYLPGFALGSTVRGTTTAASYLWAPTVNGTTPEPFAQAWLRPTIRWADLSFASIPDTGLPAQAKRVLFDNYAHVQPAGVSGLANGLTTERDTEVRSMVQIGARMFVGGNFAQVTDYDTGTITNQPYLAAFNAATGAWIPTWLPRLNGKVNAVAALPSGLLAVGGEFTTVNGTTAPGLVVLDPTTGVAATSFAVSLQRRTTTSGVTTITGGTVTTLDVQGTWLYLGGTFTHLAGGNTPTSFVFAKRGGRVNATTGKPDATWNPNFDGTPIFVKASPQGDRVYFGGFMSTMNGGANAALRFVAVTATSPAAPVSGLAPWVSSSPQKIQYQQTGLEVGDNFWLGGAEHSFFTYNRSDLSLIRGNITRGDRGAGGDFQASVADNGVAYASCHCILSYAYGGATLYSAPVNFDVIDSLRYIGAFDVQTGRDIPEFMPWIQTRAVRGPWALAVDTGGCLWAGGDLTKSKRSDGVWQSSGGFARFCHADSTPPTTPTAFRATVNAGNTVTLSWTGSTDAGGGVRYNVYRDNHVVATLFGWKATLPLLSGTSTYAVRAFDKAGNLGASTVPLAVTAA